MAQENKSEWKEITVHRFLDVKEKYTIIAFCHDDLRSPQTIRILEAEFKKVVSEIKTTFIVIDMSTVRVAPTAIFGVVLEFCALARDRELMVRIAGLAPSIKRAFELLSTKRLVTIFPTVKDAVKTPWRKKRWWIF